MQIKYLILFFILILGVGITLWWWTTKENNLTENVLIKPKEELSIVAVGDSLVAGVGSTPGNDFVSLLSQKMKVPIINEGIRGNTSAQVLKRIDPILEENDPDIVILLVGGNDALQRIPLGLTFQNIATIIKKIQASGGSVVLIGVQGSILGNTYQNQFEALATEYQTVYVSDILNNLIGDSRYMSDVVHPNDQGYAQIADKIYEEMKEKLPYEL